MVDSLRQIFWIQEIQIYHERSHQFYQPCLFIFVIYFVIEFHLVIRVNLVELWLPEAWNVPQLTTLSDRLSEAVNVSELAICLIVMADESAFDIQSLD